MDGSAKNPPSPLLFHAKVCKIETPLFGKRGVSYGRKALSAAFPVTVPVLMGYLAIGIAFG